MMPTGHAVAPASADVRGFGYGEHLLVWSWRRIVEGRVHCPVMAQEFADACGDDAREVFLSLCIFLQALAHASRWQLALQAPDAFGVTADEHQVLTLLAAAQADDHALFQAHLRWLARPSQRHELQIAAYALATALKTNRLLLPLPQRPIAPRRARWTS